MALHIYIYTYIHTYIRTYIHTYIHAYIYTHTHTYIHIYIYIYTYIYIYIHTYIYIQSHGFSDQASLNICMRMLVVGLQAFFSASAFSANIGAWNTARVTTLFSVCAATSADGHDRCSMGRGVLCGAAVIDL